MIWSANCVIVYAYVANQGATFTITETRLYVSVVTLSSQENAKLLPQLKSGLKRTINWKKIFIKTRIISTKSKFKSLSPAKFSRNKWTFCFAFENDTQRTSNKRYYLPYVEIKDYNVMIDGKKFFDQPK